jgi:type III secretory pathway component EscT
LNQTPLFVIDTAVLMACRLLPCALLWGRAEFIGVPGWSLLAAAAALVVALVPTHAVAVPCTAAAAVTELLLGAGIALAGSLFLALGAAFGAWTDQAASHRAPLWRRQLPPLLFALWALSGGPAVLVEELDASLAMIPLGRSAEELVTEPSRLLSLLPQLGLAGAVLCLPVALLRLSSALFDGLAARWSGHPLRPTRPLLPLAIALLVLIAASHLGDSAFRLLSRR